PRPVLRMASLRRAPPASARSPPGVHRTNMPDPTPRPTPRSADASPLPATHRSAARAAASSGRRVVAYDLRYAADHFTGIGRHAYCLLEALLEQPGPEHYAVLWNAALRSRFDLDVIRRHP